ncbi:MAG: radical SAM protein [Planctomycetaceae bacterium]|jgi:2-iminoacetate synthase|nr:radical SAM protein [Planctomycetaceae bacterium]
MFSYSDITQITTRFLHPETPLDMVVEEARHLTRTIFSQQKSDSPHSYWQMRLFAPIYVSNFCMNQCLYCGFRGPGTIRRSHLSVTEVLTEAEVLMNRGFRSLLIVAGESPRVTPEYLSEIIARLVQQNGVPSVEIAPQPVENYAKMVAAGCSGITLFQETYNRDLYQQYHPAGPKSDYDWRYGAIERAAEAGMPQLGFGFLLGLAADPREELIAMISQASDLMKRFPDRNLGFSLPRLHAAPNGFKPPFPVGDELFIRMYCTLRVIFPEANLVLSTREKSELRNQLASICITQMSAGSSTAPGGYTQRTEISDPQFEITDERSVTEVQNWLIRNGHHVIY